MTKFLGMLVGIAIFIGGGMWFTLSREYVAVAVALAGLAIVAGEGFRINMDKQVEEWKLETAEKKMEHDLDDKPSS